MLLFLILAVFFYFAGYRLDNIRPDVSIPGYLRKYTKPPKLIFWICACPKIKKYPFGVMTTGGIASQLLGISLVIYLIIFLAFPQIAGIIQIAGIVLPLAVAYLIPYWLSKKYPFNE